MTARVGGEMPPFSAPIARLDGELLGPWREPRQMLAEQSYGGHATIHDDSTAQKLGFQGGTIEGPTHFSQFAPLGFAAWGRRWLEAGCISAHYRTAVYEGEKVRARMGEIAEGQTIAPIWMEKEDGAEVLRGTASVGPDHSLTALDKRLAELVPLEQPVVLEGVRIGTTSPRLTVRMAPDQHMGHLYPFSLNEKLERITEPSSWYSAAGASASPYGRAIIPMEMVSVLVNHVSGEHRFYTRGPVVGLFADQEIRFLEGPLYVNESYEIESEVVGTSGSRRTESLWLRTRIYRPGATTPSAVMLLNSAIMKESYADYEVERRRLYETA